MQNSNIEISKVTEGDMGAIERIYRQSVINGTASWEYEPPNLEEITRRFVQITQLGLPYIVARIDNKIAGFAYASKYRDRIGYRFCVENSVYVDPNFHSQGVGSALLQVLIESCASRGFKSMIAVIGDSENQASIKLHKKLGFIQVGLLPKIGLKFDKWLDSVIMQRDLR